jgi:phosphoheptose isomerase
MTRRIALISEHASPLAVFGGADAGGQNVYVGEVAKQLALMGHEVDLFTRRDGDSLPEVAQWVDGVRIVHVPAGPPTKVRKEDLLEHMGAFSEFVIARARSLLEGYDVVHANFWMSGLVACEIKRALGIPFAVTFHALGKVRRAHQRQADEFPDERFAIEERIVREADAIVAECPQEEEDLIRHYNADPAKISIVPGGFDPGQFWPIGKELARAALGLGPEQPLVLQLGRMVPRKGVDTAIEGLGLLRKRWHVDAKLAIVGGDCGSPSEQSATEVERLRTVAVDAGVGQHVQFFGTRERESLRWFYSAADVFVSTPWYEPFGITPLEAMACGTPVVGSNVGGIKFTVRDGETGYLVAPRDPAAVAERLAHLYSHPKLRRTLGRQAVRRANDLFTWKIVASGLETVFERAISSAYPASITLDELASVDRNFESAIDAMKRSQLRLRATLLDAVDVIADSLGNGGKVLVCGNGGSAADAQHFAAELVGHYMHPDRPGQPVIALSCDSSLLTAWSNDVGFEEVFARQVQALGRAGDVLVGISTSGNSANVVNAFAAAKEAGVHCVGLLGRAGGRAASLADVAVVVPSGDTQRIQEVHAVALHIICELVEERLVRRLERARSSVSHARRPSETHERT